MRVTPFFVPPVCTPSLATVEEALRVFDYLAHIDALQGDGVRDMAGNAVSDRASSVFGLTHDHREPVLPIVGSCPVTGNKPGSRGNLRHNLLAQVCLSLLDITDRHPHDYRVHGAPSDRGRGAATLPSFETGGTGMLGLRPTAYTRSTNSISSTGVTLIAVLAALSVVADAETTEARAASRVLDRTFSCSVGDPSTSGYPDPIPARPRQLSLGIAPKSDSPSPWWTGPVPAHIVMTDKQGHQTREKLHISQGLEGVVEVGSERFRVPSILRLARRTCRPVTDTSIPLSPRRLRTWPAKGLEEGPECRASARIVLRVRALLRRPASLIARGGEYGLTGTPSRVRGEYVLTRTSPNRNILRVEVAVATFPALKPIAYAQIARNGAAALFASSSCVRN
jgi:hypothetical protein